MGCTSWNLSCSTQISLQVLTDAPMCSYTLYSILVPSLIANCQSMCYSQLGTLPVGIRNMTQLQVLDVSSNRLSGTLASELFTNKTQLQTFSVGSNFFFGAVPMLQSRSLLRFEISDNAFTGALPAKLFLLPKLAVFSASVNCLSVDLPPSICAAFDSLTELYLNGLGRSDKCVGKYIMPLAEDIPSCIWSMSSLQKLYLSGNGFSGSVYEHYNLTNITELQLNSNRFYGQLPLTRGQSITTLDFSSNHFTGTMDPVLGNFVPGGGSSSIKTNVNRLSGPIAVSTLNKFSSINVLNSNIFSCDTIPPNDPNKSSYGCGSRNLEIAVYFWISCLVVFVSCPCILFRYFPKVFHKWRRQFSDKTLDSNELKNVFPRMMQYLYSLSRLAEATSVISVVILILTVLVYLPLKLGPNSALYSSHEYQYQWLWSGVFLKGFGSAVSVLVLFSVVLLLIVGAFYLTFEKDWHVMRLVDEVAEKDRKADGKCCNWSDWVDWSKKQKLLNGARIFVTLLYLGVSGVVNTGYVFLRPYVNDTELFFLEASVIIVNQMLLWSLPHFVKVMFPGKPRSTLAARLTTLIIVAFE